MKLGNSGLLITYFTLLLAFSQNAVAITPTWTGATSTTWSNNANWTSPATAPGSGVAPFDTAIFTGTAIRTTANNTGTITLNSIQFNADATTYTITNTGVGNITISGGGIVNNSANTQLFSNSATLTFTNNADAGSNVTITNNTGATLSFQGDSTANNAAIITNGTGTVNISGLSANSITFGSLAGTGRVTLGSKELNVGTLNNNTTFSGIISGVGGQLTKLGTGTLILSGANTYTGNTTISAGTLQIGAGGTTGSVAGNIVDNAALVFNRSNSPTYAGVISGIGTMTKLGGGTLILTGENTYSGGTTVSAGILQVGNGGTVGSIAGNVLDNATLRFNRSDAISFAGDISGTGALSKQGVGTLTLTGNNTFTGTTTISAGTLQIGNGGTTGTITGNIVDSAALRFNRSDSLSYAGNISGTGTLIKLGAGTLSLAGTNTFSGGTTITAGTLQIGVGGTTGSITGNIANSSALDFNRSNVFTYSGVISGAGTVTQSGSGTTTLTGANTYTGGTTISGGTLQIGSGGTTGVVVGNIVDNATLIFNRSNALTFADVISGSGAMTKLGGGTLTLTGENTYSGGTTVSAGILQVGNGGTVGSIVGDVLDNATLRFNRSDAITFADDISGTGALSKQGVGTLTLTGNNTFTGTTTISAGTLQIGNGGTTGIITGNIVDSAALRFNRSDSLSYAGNISGTGTLTKLGAGTLSLAGTNTFSGGTTITAGTLQIGVGGTTGSITGNIANSSALDFNRSNAFTYSGIISGAGTVTQSGSGTTTLTGANTYTGGTTISGGTLQIGSGGTTGIVAGNIVDNATLIFNRSNALTFAAVISGTGDMTKLGANTLTLTGANTYSGTTTISAGTLQIGSGGTIGSIASDIVNNAAIIFNRSNSFSFGGDMSGTGTMTKLGAGTLILTGNNTFSGNTTITAGTLQIGNGGSTGTISGNIIDNSALIFNRAGSLNYNGVISGTGSFTKLGSGTAILTGANTYSGGTTVTAGTLQIGNGGTTGSIVGNITNDGNVAFNRSNSLTFSNVISGVGSLMQEGSGTTVLTGANTYTGGTTISEGTLQIGAGGAIGSVVGNIEDNANLTFNRSNALTFAGAISGSGNVTKLAANTLTLTGENTYSGITTISAGTLQIGNGSTIGSIASNVINNSAIIFNRSDSSAFNGDMSGTGTMTKLGAGTLTLTGNNTFSGNTTITAGTLQVGNGGSIGVITGNVINNSALIFNRAGLLSYDGVISGTGTLTKLGTGVTILNGINIYTGVTNINAGNLQIGDASHLNASIAGDVNINSAGTLSGNGTIGGNVVNAGNLSPGASIGTLSILGNYTQSVAGNYNVEVDNLGNSDLLNVTGAANLNGTIAVDASRGFSNSKVYKIVTAGGGVAGTFSNANTGKFNQGFLTGTIFYLPNEVDLQLAFNSTKIVEVLLTPNQIAVANYLLSFPAELLPTSVSGLIADLTTSEQLRSLLDQMSGATFANQEIELSRIAYGSGFEDELADHYSLFPDCQNNRYSIRKKLHGVKYEDCNQTYSVWTIAQGGKDEITPGEVSGLDSTHVGMAVGAEVPIKKNGAIGAAFGINHFNTTAVSREIATAKGELFQLGLYGRYVIKHFLIGAAIDAGITNQIKANRTIQIPQVNIPSFYHSKLFSEQARISYSMFDNILRPFAGFFNQNVSRPSFTEQGNSGFELTVGKGLYHSFRSQIGIMLDIPTNIMIRPFASITWEHEFAQDRGTFNAKLAAINSNLTFHIVGTGIGRNILVAKVGLEIFQYHRFDASVLYEGQFSSRWHENSARLQLSARF